MNQSDINYQNYVNALKNELVPAMGCTEPIAIAYCAAIAFKNLGKNCDQVLIEASGNIIKNVKSVTVPNTDGLKGIEAAAAAGIVAGNAEKKAGGHQSGIQRTKRKHPYIFEISSYYR